MTPEELEKIEKEAWKCGQPEDDLGLDVYWRERIFDLISELRKAWEKLESNVYYNTGSTPIFITTKYEVDPYGGPAKPLTNICISPGQGVDLNVLGLKRNAPEKIEGEK